MSTQISSLQEQVEQLFANLSNLKAQVDSQSIGSIATPFNHHASSDYPQSISIAHTPMLPPSPSQRRPQSASRHPLFYGPTSSAFNIGVAKTSLNTMGITSLEDGDDEAVVTENVTPLGSPPPGVMAGRSILHATKDPIWALPKQEAIRLVKVWQEEMGMMYPFMDIEQLVHYAEMLFTFVEAAARSGLMQCGLPGSDGIVDDRTSNLKLVLAIALVLEGNGKDPLGQRLFENVHSVIDHTLSRPVDLQSINMLMLTGMYHFHRDDEALAWRIIGLAARQCFELGLHRRETYTAVFTDSKEQAAAIRTFWSVYVLDRRWSFGTGLPLALQDSDIDVNIPKPVSQSPQTYVIHKFFADGDAGRQYAVSQRHDILQHHRLQGLALHRSGRPVT